MNKVTLKKDKVKIEIENTDDKKIVIRYEFTAYEKGDQDSLDDYMYLLEKIEKYLKSGEYEVTEEKESS